MITLVDGYKTGHYAQYPKGTNLVYSNWTARKSRLPSSFCNIDAQVFFGLQYFILKYLIEESNTEFFNKPKKVAIKEYKDLMDQYIGPDKISTKHIEELHDLGYWPIEIKAIPEGNRIPIGIPAFTVRNTLPQFFWVTNYIETILSCTIWQPTTSATIAYHYRQVLNVWCEKTNPEAKKDFVQWQGHDFSMRGMSSLESAKTSGAGHLLSFTGTDTIPAIQFLIKYYYADPSKELIGGTIPATEHSVASVCSVEYSTYEDSVEEVFNEYTKEWEPVRYFSS